MTPLDVLKLKVEAKRETLKREVADINAKMAQLDCNIRKIHDEIARIQQDSGTHMEHGLPAAVLQQNSRRITECHQHLVVCHRARAEMVDSRKEMQNSLHSLDGKFKSLEKRLEQMEYQKLSDMEKSIQKELDNMFGGRLVFRE
ncbi:MAG: hypothetical protein ACE5DY_07200 [Mariprofundaceae bacterium]